MRSRLVLVNVAILFVLQSVFGLAIYKMLAWNLIDREDAILHELASATSEGMAALLAEKEDPLSVPALVLATKRYGATTFAVYDQTGNLLTDKPAGSARLAPLPDEWRNLGQSEVRFTAHVDANMLKGARRTILRTLDFPGSHASYLLVISRPLDGLLAQLHVVPSLLLVAIPVVLLLNGIGAWLLTKRSLAPVTVMAEEARRISVANISKRLAVTNPRDELGQLAITFNGLLDRLEKVLSQQREFMSEAAHQMRTPISVIRTATAVTLDQPRRSESEYRDALTIVEGQSRHLTRTVEDMFRLARADAGFHELHKVSLYLDELIVDAGRTAQILAGKKGIALAVSADLESPFQGDEELLRQMTLNLLENAVKYTPCGGRVTVSLRRPADSYIIEVADTGDGIPDSHRPRIFERFYRVGQTTAEGDPPPEGAGLGLPIARWIAEEHGGCLELARSGAAGSSFMVTLPAPRVA